MKNTGTEYAWVKPKSFDDLKFPKNVAKELWKCWKDSSGFNGNAIARCSHLVNHLRYTYAETQGDDVISFAHSMVLDQMIDVGFNPVFAERILGKRLSRHEFDVFRKKWIARETINKWEESPIVEEREAFVIGQYGELDTKKEVVTKQRKGYINEFNEPIEVT